MADVGLPDLGAVIPGRAGDPVLSPGQAATRTDVLITPPPKPQTIRTVFGGDHATGADALGVDETIDHLAQLAIHKGTMAPLCIGLLGGAGSGKSFALGRLTARIRDLAALAGGTQGPFLSDVHVQPLDAASLGGDPATDLAAALHQGLARPYPDLAREIGHAARDPHVVLRETNEKLDEARRRLDSERRALDDAGSRRARLVETVLYEAAGSQVDAYARANRASLETRMNAFGIHGDPIRDYKDFVQFVAGSGGRLGLALRSIWSFKGQAKLIVTAITLMAIGIGLGIAIDDQDRWLAALRTGPQAGAATAGFMEAHPDLLAWARKGAFILAALAILFNLYRAFAFLQPIFKGARLLTADLDSRRRDLDGLYAHQTKRVDMLDGDVERLTRASGEAERRIGSGGSADPSPFAATAPSQARDMFAVLARLMTSGGGIKAPRRIIIALDHLDAVAPERARAILDAMHRLAGPGLLTIAAADPTRVAEGRREVLERWIQVPVRLDAAAHQAQAADHKAIVRQALGHPSEAQNVSKLDASQSILDQPVEPDEADMLVALSPLAGHSPRAVKRFANLYTLARHGEAPHGILALMLALAHGGTDADKALVERALAGDPTSMFHVTEASPALRGGLQTVMAADGPVTTGQAASAWKQAGVFSL